MLPGLLVTAPHASTRVPEWLAERIQLDEAALWNLHDPGSAEVAAGLAAEVTALGTVSRAVVDLDQEIPDDFGKERRFLVEDWHGRTVMRPELDWDEKGRLIREEYRPWYQDTRQRREALLRSYGRVLHLDLNAVGVHETPPERWPHEGDIAPLALANGGLPDTAEGERVASRPQVLMRLKGLLETAFETEVVVNDYFKGGGVMRYFGHHPGDVIQLTWDRRLVCTDDQRALDPHKVRLFLARLQPAVEAWVLQSLNLGGAIHE